MIYDGSSFGTATFAGSDEEADYLGLPGLLDADQMRALLRQRQQTQVEANSAKAAAPQPTAAVVSDRERPRQISSVALRKELNGLVAMNVHRTG